MRFALIQVLENLVRILKADESVELTECVWKFDDHKMTESQYITIDIVLKNKKENK